MKILLTGFGPFPGVPDNRSAQIVEGFVASPALRGHEIHRQVLPTTYEDSQALVDRLVASLKPELCLGLGVWRGQSIRLERVARNATMACTPDAAGVVRQGVHVEGGADTHASSLPLAAIERRLLQGGFPVECSDDAGGYVCNHVFYRACHATRAEGLATACGFIHIPHEETAMPDGSPLSIQRLAEVVELVILASTESQAART